MDTFDVAVIGGGVVGLYSALDLISRGFRVILFERDAIGSGTSGRHHGLLHSGARYAVADPVSAIECREESEILYNVAKHAIEDTSGYFVAVTDDDEKYKEEFIKGLKDANIKFKEVDVNEALKEEPNLTSNVKSVIEVPDRVIYAKDLLASIAMTAYNYGALIIDNAEVVGFEIDNDEIVRVKVLDKVKNRVREVKARVYVNAAGPWAGKVASLAGIKVNVMPTAGIMVVFRGKLTRRVINRMRPPSDGDILLPYGGNSIMGTTAILIEDPDDIEVTDEDIEFLTMEGAKMIPKLQQTPIVRAYASVRPLLKIEGENVERKATRSFRVVEHEKPKNMISIVGGKFTTARLVAEKACDTVCKLLNEMIPSKTKTLKLLGEDPYCEVKDLGLKLDYLTEKALESYKGSLDEDRGRVIPYTLILTLISKNSRTTMGW